jgi:hypothetical protein
VPLVLLLVSFAGSAFAVAPPPPAATLPQGCRRFRIDVVQSGTVPLLGGEEERFLVLGALEDGAWRDVQVTVIADPNPENPLWAEGDWPFPLGGDRTRGISEGPTPKVVSQSNGWRFVWRRDAMTYRVDTGPAGQVVSRERFTLPDKVSSDKGWAKDIVWELRHDEAGWPKDETLSLVAGRGLLRVQLQYGLTYAHLGPCAVDVPDTPDTMSGG